MKPGKDFIGVGGGVMFFDEKFTKILLLKRSTKTKNTNLMWSNPGGAIDLFETAEQGIRREMKEELNAEVENMTFVSYFDNILKEEGQHWLTIMFYGHLKDGYFKNMEPEKFDDMRWFQLNDLPDNCAPRLLDGLKKLKEKGII